MSFHGAPGADTIFAATPGGVETIHGAAGGAYSVSGAKSVVFIAGTGTETFDGAAGTGKQTMLGSTVAGAEELLLGGSGANLFEVTASNAVMAGGSGKNVFEFFSHADTTTQVAAIINFKKNDRIELTGFGAGAVKAVLATEIRSPGEYTSITLPDGTTVTLAGGPKLSAKDFMVKS